MKRRGADPSAYLLTILSSRPFSEAEATSIVNTVRIAQERMVTGTAEARHFLTLGAAINVAAVRAEECGSAEDALATLDAAGRALTDCQDRRDRLGRYGLTGPGIHQLAAGVDVYEALLRASSPRQMAKAQDEVIRRLNVKAAA